MEEVKMQYRDYKRHYANCETVRGSYDASSKTIIVLVPASMMQPKRSASRFDPKRWENRGQQKKRRTPRGVRGLKSRRRPALHNGKLVAPLAGCVD